MTQETDALQAQNAELQRNLRAAQRVANQQATTITGLQFELAKSQELAQEQGAKLAGMLEAGCTPDLPPAQPNPNRKTRRAAAAKK